MKKLTILALLLFTAKANAGGWDHAHGGSQYVSDSVKEFIRVKNTETFDMIAGVLVRPDTAVSSEGVNPMGVTVKHASTAAGQNQLICVTVNAIVSGAFGLCQTSGYHPGVQVRGDVTNVTKGGVLSLGVGVPGFADGNTSNQRIGLALEASTTSQTVPAYLQLR